MFGEGQDRYGGSEGLGDGVKELAAKETSKFEISKENTSCKITQEQGCIYTIRSLEVKATEDMQKLKEEKKKATEPLQW